MAYVLEQAGTPPHSGTHVTFTTTLGTVEPAEANTDTSGRAVARFLAGPTNGNAMVTAASGGATTGTDGAVRIAVGTAAVSLVIVNANPATVLNSGGSTLITASVVDINGNALPSAPVAFTTTAGTLSASVVVTDSGGQASTTLTTSQTAEVTATVGSSGTGGGTGTGDSSAPGRASATVTVNVTAAPTIIITPPSSPPSAGLPALFTFAVTVATDGSAVRNVAVEWGDGESQNLGALSGTQTVSHVYDDDGTYTVTATVTDAAGNSNTVSTSVTVIPVPRPTVIVTPSPQTQFAGGLVTFSVQVTVPPGIGVVRTTISFGDGEVRELGGASSASVAKTYSTPGTFTVTVTVTDTVGQVTEGTTTVAITN